MAFEKHARTVSLLTLVSRMSGLARDAVQSRVFGAGPVMDAFALAFQIPNLFRRLFGEGALTASFLPVYTRLERDDPAAARRFAGTTIALLVIVLSALTVIGELVLAALPVSNADQSLTVRLTATMLPYMPMVCLVALLGTILGVHGRFGPASASPVLLNAAIIVGAGLAWWIPGEASSELGRARIGWVAMAVMVAGLAQLAWMMWSMRGQRIRPMLDVRGSRAPLLETVRAALPMMLGLGVFQLNVLMDSLIASYPTSIGPTIMGVPFPLPQGSNATINWATRLYEFPLGVFGISVATVIFPLLSRQSNDMHQFMHTLRRGIRLVVFIGVPASAGLLLVATPMTATVFQGGRCGPEEVQRIATVLIAFAPAVVAYSAMQLLTRAFYALGDQRTPTRLSMAMVALNLLLNVSLIWTPLGLSGLAWSTTICAFIQWALLGRMLSRRMGRLMDDLVWKSVGKTMFATAVMSLATWGLGQLLPFGADWWGMCARLACLAAAGALVMFVVAHRLHMPEWRWALGMADPEGRTIEPEA